MHFLFIFSGIVERNLSFAPVLNGTVRRGVFVNQYMCNCCCTPQQEYILEMCKKKHSLCLVGWFVRFGNTGNAPRLEPKYESVNKLSLFKDLSS